MTSHLHKRYPSLFAAFLALVLSVSAPLTVMAAEAQTAGSGAESTEPFRYEHDPMENPEAAADIIVNPDAPYGFSPNPDSTRLGKFVNKLDWTDKDEVADAQEDREKYHRDFQSIYDLIEDLYIDGKDVEEIARAVCKKRNEIRLASYADDPKGLAIVKKSNLETYGQEEGATPDQLYEQYGSWLTVILKALSSNPGMDACVGLYDKYYETYGYADTLSQMLSEQENGDATSVASDANSDASDANSDAGDAKSSGTYTVVKGDCLWSIAADKLGDGNRWPEIYDANKDKIKNPRLIYAGQELVLPAA